MKSFIALVAVLALTGTVQAAPIKAKATRSASAKKASKGVRVAAVKKQSAKASAAADSEATSMSSGIELKETASAANVAPATAAKKWSAALDVESYAPIKGVNESKTGSKADKLNDGETDYAAKVGYKITDTVALTGVAEWFQMWGQNDAKSETTLSDPYLKISKSDLADLGNGVALSGQARIYAPISELSQDKEQIAQIRAYLTASRQISKALTASFTLSPRIFAQQNDQFVQEDGTMGNLDTFRLLSFAGVKYSINEIVALEQTFGVYQKWKTHTERGDYLFAESSAYVTVTNWLELNVGVRQSDGATDMRKGGLRNLYSSDQAEYFLIGSFSI